MSLNSESGGLAPHAAPSVHSTLAQWLDYLGSLHVSAIDLGLTRVGKVWQHLKDTGVAGTAAKTVFTAAGTNGKGSTTEALSQLLTSAGFKVGLYQSPHLHVFNERMRVGGQNASDAELIQAFVKVEAARVATSQSLSFFEATTLAAFLVFEATECDAWVLEVGLGGRLDAVNLIDADVALITSIGLDHADWLGSDLEQIGREKAGIVRAGKLAVLGPGLPCSVEQHASELGCELVRFGHEFYAQAADADWLFSSQALSLKLPYPSLAWQNVALALAAVLAAGVPLSLEQIQSALKRMHMPGRFEAKQVLGKKLVYDALHNPLGAEFFVAQAKAKLGAVQLHIVFSMLADKQIKASMQVLHEAFKDARWHLAAVDHSRAASKEQLSLAATELGLPAGVYDSVAAAYTSAFNQLGEDQVLVVCGSFHTLDEARRMEDTLK